MPLVRVLETEAMDSAEEALDYDSMDHSAVNRLFVDDLLATGAFAEEESKSMSSISAPAPRKSPSNSAAAPPTAA